MVTLLSNRPDLAEYQCNGAMAAKKEYAKAPRKIAEKCAAEAQSDSDVFSGS
jgi:arginyl-tRNA synthetase